MIKKGGKTFLFEVLPNYVLQGSETWYRLFKKKLFLTLLTKTLQLSSIWYQTVALKQYKAKLHKRFIILSAVRSSAH